MRAARIALAVGLVVFGGKLLAYEMTDSTAVLSDALESVVNVVAAMRETGAIIGGEGNGGVIYPELHAGRDALVGIALMLTLLARRGGTMTALRATYPHYEMVKAKIDLDPAWDVDALLDGFAARQAAHAPLTVDGVKLDLAEGWVHLRKSNTEPIVRVYAEATSPEAALNLVDTYKKDLLSGA